MIPANAEKLCYHYCFKSGIDLIGLSSNGNDSIMTWRNPASGFYGVYLMSYNGDEEAFLKGIIATNLNYTKSCSVVLETISKSAKETIGEIKYA